MAAAFLEHYHTAPVGQVVVNRVPAGISSVSQKDAAVVDGVVIVVVVTAEDAHHVAALQHSIEEAAVELRVAYRFAESSHPRQLGLIFRERNMKEGKARYGLASVSLRECAAGLPVPADLVGVHRLVHLLVPEICP